MANSAPHAGKAAQSGDAEKIASAKQKAGAVQKERLGKMKEMLTSLGAN